jgi:general secretion pathway protein E
MKITFKGFGLAGARASNFAPLVEAPHAAIPATAGNARGGTTPLEPSAEMATIEVLTAAGGPIPVSDDHRKNCAVVAETRGTTTEYKFYVRREHLTNAVVLTVADLARGALGITLPRPIPCDHADLRALYGEAATRGLQNASEIKARFLALIDKAAACGASDIQVELIGELAEVRFQVDGYLTDVIEEYDIGECTALFTTAFFYGDHGDEVEQPTEDQLASVTSRDKMPPALGGLRMFFSPRPGGRHMNIRCIRAELPIKGDDLTPLGLEPDQEAMAYAILGMGWGLFTSGAPTEAGKSQTLTTFMRTFRKMRGNRVKVAGAADPPETMEKGITLFDVKSETSTGEDPYIKVLKALLRTAPHAVMLAECRGASAANAAFDISNIGKWCGASLHTGEALTIPERYVELGVDPRLAFNAKRHIGWESQRLLPKLCVHCRVQLVEAAKTNLRYRSELSRYRDLLGSEADTLYVRGPGCSACSSTAKVTIPGLHGRKLVAEIIVPTEELCALLRENLTAGRGHWLNKMGGISMRVRALPLLLSGQVGVAEFSEFLVNSDEDFANDLAMRPHQEAAE